jgi:hypothetical protein
MVSVGFICEGDTEVKIVKSDAFQKLLTQLNLRCVLPIQDAEGNGNLLPHNLTEKRDTLKQAGADTILILTDLDIDTSIEITKKRIGEHPDHRVIVSVQQVEAWFLADSVSISALVEETIYVEYPESETQPFEFIRKLLLAKTGRGVGTKPILAKRMIRSGFTIQAAAEHPNCPSAHAFLTTLKTIATAN